jgi:hypothetical protein
MPVPTVLAWMVGVAGVAALAKVAAKEWKKAQATMRPADARRATEPFRRESLPTLRRDPRTGIYRAD